MRPASFSSIIAKRIGLLTNHAIVPETISTTYVNENSKQLDGLHATLDKLVHHKEKSTVKGVNLHAFIYFISINNLSDRKITLLGRKWILSNSDGTTTVVEGEKIVGETPTIDPGDTFSYNSYHVTHLSAIASGSFHGVDDSGHKIHVKMAPFQLDVPDKEKEGEGLS
jgi:ApaG protein